VPPLKEKVLVIDDDRLTLELCEEVLRELDLDLICARSAREGMLLARAQRPNLVLIEITMAYKDGYDFLSMLRADPELEPTPVVMIAGDGTLQDRLRAVYAGAAELLTKPFDEAELAARVKSLLRLGRSEAELRECDARLRARARLLQTLFVIGGELRDVIDPSDVSRIVREALVSIVGAESFSVYARENGSTPFYLVVDQGVDGTRPGEILDPRDLPAELTEAVADQRVFVHRGAESRAPRLCARHPGASLPVIVAQPLVSDEIVIGLIIVHHGGGEQSPKALAELVSMLGTQVAGAIHASQRLRRFRDHDSTLEAPVDDLHGVDHSLAEQMFHLNTLLLFSAGLHGTIDLNSVYAQIRDLIVNFIGVDGFFVTYCDELEGASTYVGTADNSSTDPASIDPARYAVVTELVRASGDSYFRDRPLAALGDLPPEERPIACLPLKAGADIYGVLGVMTLLPHMPGLGAEHRAMLAWLVEAAALAIRNAHVHRLVVDLSRVDGLTGALNRRAFDEALEDEVKRARRYDLPLSLIMIDLDDFKQVNDLCSHPAGDAVLREVVLRIRSQLRDTDVLARYGGDEFAFILPCTTLESASEVAERARAQVAAEPVVFGRQAIRMTISQGAAEMLPSDSPEHLVRAADLALLRAKRTGKNRTVTSAREPGEGASS